MNSISACGSIHSLVDELLRHIASESGKIESIIMSSDMAMEIFCHCVSLYELHGRERNSGQVESEAAFKIRGIPAIRNPFLPSSQVQLVMRTKTIKLVHAP